MKLVRMAIAFSLTAALALAGAAGWAQTKSAHPAFEIMKALAGQWEGTRNDNHPVRVTYQLVSEGTAVQETIYEQGGVTMVSIYHPDGDRLVMTHYCAAGNQPRMVAEAPGDARRLTFIAREVANLASPADGHMGSLTIRFTDSNHIAHQWTWYEGGKPHHTAQFSLTRVQ